MRDLLASTFAIAMMFSVALAEEPAWMSSPSVDLLRLSDGQMDQIKAGSWNIFGEDMIDCLGPDGPCSCPIRCNQLNQQTQGGGSNTAGDQVIETGDLTVDLGALLN